MAYMSRQTDGGGLQKTCTYYRVHMKGFNKNIHNQPAGKCESDSRNKGSVPLSTKTAKKSRLLYGKPLIYSFYLIFNICCYSAIRNTSAVNISTV